MMRVSLMVRARATVFNVLFYAWILLLGVVAGFLLLLPRRFSVPVGKIWARVVGLLLRWTVGLTYEVRGIENRPVGAVLVASKHQSAWETIIFLDLLRDPAYIIKQELFALPVYGWFSRKLGMIGIDRKGGGATLKTMTKLAKAALAAGRPVVIFPEGTRMPPGVTGTFLPGIFSIYRQCDVPVVPVALNSGHFWGRNAFVKRPGVIVLEYLPAIPTGLDRKQFMSLLEERIETATLALEGLEQKSNRLDSEPVSAI
jgi:1-acyl-sn-glycerol-3-phosphate acyltransferase